MKKRNYKFGIFYYAKNDSRLLMDEHLNLSRAIAFNGQIVNFAHWKKVVGFLGLGLLVGVVVLTMFR